LTAVGAFIGDLFQSFISVIIFSKVLRVQANAQVTFSNILIIRYGQGVISDDNLNLEKSKLLKFNRIPCPVLDILVVNRFHNYNGGEVMDASIIASNKDYCEVNKDKQIQYRIELQESSNPFFKRIWKVSHVLDSQSPLLTPSVRRYIVRKSGYWPEELNNPESIKASLNFDTIVAHFSGTSNVSAIDVYANKIYDINDTIIGYQFANMLYRDKNNTIQVNESLINDVVEQDGGGGQSLDGIGVLRFDSEI